MDISDLDYDLPEDRIAQQALAERDASRLLVLDRRTGRIEHRVFKDLPDLLDPDDLLVLNDTKVLPARLFGQREETGGRIEVLLLEERGEGVWTSLVRGSARLRAGARIVFGEGVHGVIEDREDPERVRIRFSPAAGFRLWLARKGHVPLPPYIRRPDEPEDRERYQTVYAKNEGAIAAPTAGLHFTPELLNRLEKRGIERAALTLHVGPGTFRPIRTQRIEEHRMDAENSNVPPETARRVGETLSAGKRVVAVGTTVVRTLEGRAVSDPDGNISVPSGRAPISFYITPGYEFRVVGGLVTNFHLPRSTLLALVAAFAGRDRVLNAYAEALRRDYRFYSYGDAMLIF